MADSDMDFDASDFGVDADDGMALAGFSLIYKLWTILS
jgi:hypothetical protein